MTTEETRTKTLLLELSHLLPTVGIDPTSLVLMMGGVVGLKRFGLAVSADVGADYISIVEGRMGV